MKPVVVNQDELPLVLRVEDIQKILGVARGTAYELVRSKDFPSIRVSHNRIVVPRKSFFDWMENAAAAEK